MSIIIHNAYPNSTDNSFINLRNQAYIVFFLTKIGYIYLQFWLIDN